MAKEKKSEKSTLRQYLEAIGLAVILALIIRTWGVQAFKIPSESMVPTLLVGDHLLVFKSNYDIKFPFSDRIFFSVGDPKRGDIIVFRFPDDRDKDFIKRVIGLPGETVEMRGRKVFIDGREIKDPWGYYHNDTSVRPGQQHEATFRVVVPPEHYFVLGDNRDDSKDSRFWRNTFVPRQDILGRAIIIYWAWEGQDWGIRFKRIGKLLLD